MDKEIFVENKFLWVVSLTRIKHMKTCLQRVIRATKNSHVAACPMKIKRNKSLKLFSHKNVFVYGRYAAVVFCKSNTDITVNHNLIKS